MTHNIRWVGHFSKNRKYLCVRFTISLADCLQLLDRRLRAIQFLSLTSDLRHVFAKPYRSHIACQHSRYYGHQSNLKQYCHRQDYRQWFPWYWHRSYSRNSYRDCSPRCYLRLLPFLSESEEAIIAERYYSPCPRFKDFVRCRQ